MRANYYDDGWPIPPQSIGSAHVLTSSETVAQLRKRIKQGEKTRRPIGFGDPRDQRPKPKQLTIW